MPPRVIRDVTDARQSADKLYHMHQTLLELGFSENKVSKWLSDDPSICNMNSRHLWNLVQFMQFQGVPIKYIHVKHLSLSYPRMDRFIDDVQWHKHFNSYMKGKSSPDIEKFKARCVARYEDGDLHQDDYAELFTCGLDFDSFKSWEKSFNIYKSDPCSPAVQKWARKQMNDAIFRGLSKRRLIMLRQIRFPFQDHPMYDVFSYWDYGSVYMPKRRERKSRGIRLMSPVQELDE